MSDIDTEEQKQKQERWRQDDLRLERRRLKNHLELLDERLAIETHPAIFAYEEKREAVRGSGWFSSFVGQLNAKAPGVWLTAMKDALEIANDPSVDEHLKTTLREWVNGSARDGFLAAATDADERLP